MGACAPLLKNFLEHIKLSLVSDAAVYPVLVMMSVTFVPPDILTLVLNTLLSVEEEKNTFSGFPLTAEYCPNPLT